MKKILSLLVLAVFFPVLACAASIPTLDNAGLTDILEKNRGKVVLLNFFATWCPPCRVELPELKNLREAVPDKELLIVGLSVDEEESPVPEFIKEAGVNYPVYMADKSITDKYGIQSVPHNIFFAPNGSLEVSEPGMAETRILEAVIDDLKKHK